METIESPETAENREEKEEKKGAGFFASLLNKLGLGGAPGGAGAGIGVGGAGVAGGSGGFGLGGGILATKAGIVALILTGTTIAAGVGVVGRSALSGRSGGVTDSIYSLFPGKAGASSGASASAGAASGGVSSSLDLMSQAANNDPMLKEPVASAEAVASASADAAAPGQVGVPDNANAPANVGSARPKGALQKTPGFANATSGGGGGSMSARGSEAGGRNASNAARVGGLNAMARNMASTGGAGRRSLIGTRGKGAGGQLQSAVRDGRASGARNPATAASRVGTTFDNSGRTQASDAGAPAAMTGGAVDQGARSRFSPNKVLDQREVPPVKKVDSEKDSTAYKPYLYTAIGALLAAMALMFFAGKKKDAALADPDPISKAALLQTAATLHWLAAAAAALALAMGVILMTAYGQKMQGLMFAIGGGLLAAFNVKHALDATAGSAKAKTAEADALQAAQDKHQAATNLLSKDPNNAVLQKNVADSQAALDNLRTQQAMNAETQRLAAERAAAQVK